MLAPSVLVKSFCNPKYIFALSRSKILTKTGQVSWHLANQAQVSYSTSRSPVNDSNCGNNINDDDDDVVVRDQEEEQGELSAGEEGTAFAHITDDNVRHWRSRESLRARYANPANRGQGWRERIILQKQREKAFPFNSSQPIMRISKAEVKDLASTLQFFDTRLKNAYQHPGFQGSQLLIDSESNVITSITSWENQASLDENNESEHYKSIMEEFREHIVDVPTVETLYIGRSISGGFNEKEEAE